MKISKFNLILFLIIFIQMILIVYLLIKQENYKIEEVYYYDQFNRKDTVEILKQLLTEEKKLNRIKWDSTKKIIILKYPYLLDNYSKELKDYYAYFDIVPRTIHEEDRLSVLSFKISKDSIAFIEYSIGFEYKGAIRLKKSSKWITTHFTYAK